MTQHNMKKSLKLLTCMLPFVFLMHNIEEAWVMEKWINITSGYPLLPFTAKQFVIAAGLFSILGFIIVYARKLYKTEEQYATIIAGFSGMILLNILISHLMGVIYLGTYTPGLITALIPGLPLSFFILFLIYKLDILHLKQILLSTLAGGGVGMLLIFLFLQTGKLFA